MKNNLILYNTDYGKAKIELHIENETIWLNQLELADLFQMSKQNISKHSKPILNEGELNKDSTINCKLTVQNISYYLKDIKTIEQKAKKGGKADE